MKEYKICHFTHPPKYSSILKSCTWVPSSWLCSLLFKSLGVYSTVEKQSKVKISCYMHWEAWPLGSQHDLPFFLHPSSAKAETHKALVCSLASYNFLFWVLEIVVSLNQDVTQTGCWSGLIGCDSTLSLFSAGKAHSPTVLAVLKVL